MPRPRRVARRGLSLVIAGLAAYAFTSAGHATTELNCDRLRVDPEDRLRFQKREDDPRRCEGRYREPSSKQHLTLLGFTVEPRDAKRRATPFVKKETLHLGWLRSDAEVKLTARARTPSLDRYRMETIASGGTFSWPARIPSQLGLTPRDLWLLGETIAASEQPPGAECTPVVPLRFAVGRAPEWEQSRYQLVLAAGGSVTEVTTAIRDERQTPIGDPIKQSIWGLPHGEPFVVKLPDPQEGQALQPGSQYYIDVSAAFRDKEEAVFRCFLFVHAGG